MQNFHIDYYYTQAKVPDQYISIFPNIKNEFIQKHKISEVAFTTFRNQSSRPFSCGKERIDPGMTALFAYIKGTPKLELKIEVIYGKPPLIQRGRQTCKYDENYQSIDCDEVYFHCADKDVMDVLSKDSTVTVTDATNEEIEEILTTFDGYSKDNRHEYNFHIDHTPEFSKYCEDPEEYKERVYASPPLMVKIEDTLPI